MERSSAADISGRPSERDESHFRRGERRVIGEIGLHQMMREAMNLDFVQSAPTHAPKQGDVLALNVREKLLAAARMRRRYRKANQRRAQSSHLAKRFGHGETRSPPDTGRAFVDAHGANNNVVDNRKRR